MQRRQAGSRIQSIDVWRVVAATVSGLFYVLLLASPTRKLKLLSDEQDAAFLGPHSNFVWHGLGLDTFWRGIPLHGVWLLS